MAKKRRYDWIPDVPKHEDLKFSMKLYPVLDLPLKIDLTPNASPVEDQGNLGSCVDNAVVGCLEYLEMVRQKRSFMDYSRLFLYYNVRKAMGTIGQDSGSSIRDAVSSAHKLGVCAETLWPYNIAKFKSKPPKKCYDAALANKVVKYERVNTLSEILTAIANGYPVVFGFSVYESFESAEVAKTGIVNMPKEGERFLGGHGVAIFGYDRSPGTARVLVRNSWGSKWGMQGYFTMPFDYISNRNLSDDFWVIYK